MGSRRPARAGGGRRRRCRDAIARWCRTSRATARRRTGRRASTPARPTSARLRRRETFTLGGYSMGGRIALHTALTLGPEIVTGWCSWARAQGSPTPPSASGPPRGRRRAGRADRDARHRGVRARVGRSAAVRRPARAGRRGGARRSAAQHAGRAGGALRGLGTGVMEPLWDRLPELSIPVTLIVGARDAKFRGIADAMLAAATERAARGGRRTPATRFSSSTRPRWPTSFTSRFPLRRPRRSRRRRSPLREARRTPRRRA